MNVEPAPPIGSRSEQKASVLPFQSEAAERASVEWPHANLDFESWLALCNLSTWLDLAESKAQEQRRSA